MEAARLAADAQVDTWDRPIEWWGIALFVASMVIALGVLLFAPEVRDKVGGAGVAALLIVLAVTGGLPREDPVSGAAPVSYTRVAALYDQDRGVIARALIEPPPLAPVRTSGSAALWVGDDDTVWVGIDGEDHTVTAAKVDVKGLTVAGCAGVPSCLADYLRFSDSDVQDAYADLSTVTVRTTDGEKITYWPMMGRNGRALLITQEAVDKAYQAASKEVSGPTPAKRHAPGWLKGVLVVLAVGVVVAGGVTTWRGARRNEEINEKARSGRW